MSSINKSHLGRAIDVKYVNGKGESSSKRVIPVRMPLPNITTIDVSDLEVKEQQEMETLVGDYLEYYQERTAAIFSFEDWVEHSTGQPVSPKWRALQPNNVEVIK